MNEIHEIQDEILNRALEVALTHSVQAVRLAEACCVRKATTEKNRGYAYALTCALRKQSIPNFNEVRAEAQRLHKLHFETKNKKRVTLNR